MLSLEGFWTIAKFLFRVYQYTCYFFLFILLLPVIALYIFDFTLYLCRLVTYCCKWQAYHIKNQSGTNISFISGRNGRILNRKEPQVEPQKFEIPGEPCGSSGASILSGLDNGSEQSLSDTPYSSNYCLTSSPHDFQMRKSVGSRRSTIAGSGDRLRCASLIPEQLHELVRTDPQFADLRRTKSTEIALH